MRKLLLMPLLLMLGNSAATTACSCRFTPLERHLTYSTAVFVGRVEAVDQRQGRARLWVTEFIKGRFAAASTVNVRADTGTSCMAPAVDGAEILVFLDEFANSDPGINRCNAFLVRPVQLPQVRWEPEPRVLEFLRTTVKEYLTRRRSKPAPPPAR